MPEDLVTVLDASVDKPVLVYVDTKDNWEAAAIRAAAFENVEVIVHNGNDRDGIVVYSDNPALKSGDWWRNAILEHRIKSGLPY